MVAAFAGVLWALLAWWILPDLIRSAYDDVGWGPLNRVISGQDVWPLSHYLDLWSRLRAFLTGGSILVGGAILLAWSPLLGALSRARAGILEEGPVRVGSLVLVGASCGWLSGAIEGLSVWVANRGRPYSLGLTDLVITPSVGLLAGLTLALAVRILAGRTPPLRALAVPLVAAPLLYAGIRGAEWGLAPWAVALLALGLGVQVARLAGSSSDRWRSRRPLVVGVSALLWAACVAWVVAGDRARTLLAAGDLGASDAPNVLLLILDTTRSSNLGLYGHRPGTSKTLDRLASEGVVFDMAFAVSPWTLPSHATLLTGQWPAEHTADWETPLDAVTPMLPEAFAAHGYATGGFVGNVTFASRATGLARGFETYRDHPLTLGDLASRFRLTSSVALAFHRFRGRENYRLGRKAAGRVNGEFLDWLDDTGDRPFFAMLNYFDAHDPYLSPEPFSSRFRDPPPRSSTADWGKSREYSSDELSELEDAYDSAIAWMDAALEELLEELRYRGVLDRTLIVVTADHGEHFGEHGLVMHGGSLYREVLRVPLLIIGPSASMDTLPPAGHRIREPVSIRDVPATVLELAGLGEVVAFPGRSLSRYWRGPEAASEPIFFSLSKPLYPRRMDPAFFGAMEGAVLDGLHYVRRGDGEEELFDLEADPAETTNLSGDEDYAEVLGRLRAAVDSMSAIASRKSPP